MSKIYAKIIDDIFISIFTLFVVPLTSCMNYYSCSYLDAVIFTLKNDSKTLTANINKIDLRMKHINSWNIKTQCNTWNFKTHAIFDNSSSSFNFTSCDECKMFKCNRNLQHVFLKQRLFQLLWRFQRSLLYIVMTRSTNKVFEKSRYNQENTGRV